MIRWRETCRPCRGRGFLGEDWTAKGSHCTKCDGMGHVPIAGAPGFGCEMTLADRVPGDIVIIGTGDRVRVQWHQPRKTPKQRPIDTFVGLFVDDFGGEKELTSPIPLPSSFGVTDIVSSRIAGDMSDGRGDAVDPLARRARKRGALL